MTWPASDVTTTNLDAGTDNPQTARADLLDLAQKFNQLRNHVSAFVQTVLDDADGPAVCTTIGAFNRSFIPAGTAMVFPQTTPPAGWTKSVTHNDKALRVVTGSVGSGGATAFSSVFGAGKNAGATTLTAAQIPAHTHPITDPGHAHTYPISNQSGGGGLYGYESTNGVFFENLSTNSNTTGITGTGNNTGGGGSHSHTLSLDLQYVDVVIATKDAY